MIPKKITGNNKQFDLHLDYHYNPLFSRLLCVLFGTIGIIIGGLMARRYYLYRLKQIENEKRKKELELSRRERRKRVRDDDLTESQRCVVCRANPREVCVYA